MEFGPPIEPIIETSSKDVLSLRMLHDYEDQVCAQPELTPVQLEPAFVEFEPPIDRIIGFSFLKPFSVVFFWG